MAKATAGPRRTPRVIKLTLTEGEADMIRAVLSHVGGHNRKSPRKYVNRVAAALDAVLGYRYDETDAHPLLETTPAGLMFRNYGADSLDPDLTALIAAGEMPGVIVVEMDDGAAGTELDSLMAALERQGRVYAGTRY
jgi:hypothetical protein